jgi:hypothetical protein
VVCAVTSASLVVASLAGGAVQFGCSANRPSELIAFTRADGVYVMRADGSGVRRIMAAGPEALYGGCVAWSPESRKLVVAAGKGMWLLDADGRNGVRVAIGSEP